MLKIKPVSLILFFILITGGVSAQNLTALQKYSDSKNGFSLSYPKSFKVKKNSSGIEIFSNNKAVVVNVKIYDSKELAGIAAKASKSSADTFIVLQSVVSAQGVTKELDSSMSTMPQEYISDAKADSGSLTKYDMKKKNARFVCRSMVFAKGEKMISLSYSIAEKKGNEKYEKPADEILKSFAFAN